MRNLPQLLRDAERRVNAHVFHQNGKGMGRDSHLASIPANRDTDTDLLLIEAANRIEKLEAELTPSTIAPEFDEAGKAHMRDKAARVPIELQAYGHMSDEWVADRVRMLRHRDLDHEAICCAARDRIMRLSLRVAKLEAVIREIADGFVPDGAYVGRPLYEMAPEMCSPASRHVASFRG